MSENYKPLSAAEKWCGNCGHQREEAGNGGKSVDVWCAVDAPGSDCGFNGKVCVMWAKKDPAVMLQPPADAAVREAVEYLEDSVDIGDKQDGGAGISGKKNRACLRTLLSYVRAAQADSAARGEADAMLAAMFGECAMCGEGPGCGKDCDGYDHWTPKHDASPKSVELLRRLRLADVGKLATALRAAQCVSPLTEEQVGALERKVTGLESALAGEKAAREHDRSMRWALPDTLTAGCPDDIRALGWAVAVHNDHKLNGVKHTFWLFTKGDGCVKGEGLTDAEALNEVRSAIAAFPGVFGKEG